jgi:hypothetical protein
MDSNLDIVLHSVAEIIRICHGSIEMEQLAESRLNQIVRQSAQGPIAGLDEDPRKFVERQVADHLRAMSAAGKYCQELNARQYKSLARILSRTENIPLQKKDGAHKKDVLCWYYKHWRVLSDKLFRAMDTEKIKGRL